MKILLSLIKLLLIFLALKGQNRSVRVLLPPGTLFPTRVVFGPVGFKEAAGDFLFSINCLTKEFFIGNLRRKERKWECWIIRTSF